MTTPLILNVVIVSTKHLLHVYHCQQSILVEFNAHKFYIQSPDSFQVLGIWGGTKGHIIGFWADPKGTLWAPKGTVPFEKGLARTLGGKCLGEQNMKCNTYFSNPGKMIIIIVCVTCAQTTVSFHTQIYHKSNRCGPVGKWQVNYRSAVSRWHWKQHHVMLSQNIHHD